MNEHLPYGQRERNITNYYVEHEPQWRYMTPGDLMAVKQFLEKQSMLEDKEWSLLEFAQLSMRLSSNNNGHSESITVDQEQ